ncbi:unnamed protein product [Pleuronectes platessa]|uniref:Ig-like domain-containing protein n=1 Tax=Pleuronectes platessa TaxID=8262 RepID=A0A9N7YYW0_PLEPL|nr:unnamed protein product [Pleuronectes platessa]
MQNTAQGATAELLKSNPRLKSQPREASPKTGQKDTKTCRLKTVMPENPDVNWPPLLSLSNMRSVSKVRLLSFLLCLALTFLVMASYILPREKTGLLFIPPPFQLQPVIEY